MITKCQAEETHSYKRRGEEYRCEICNLYRPVLASRISKQIYNLTCFIALLSRAAVSDNTCACWLSAIFTVAKTCSIVRTGTLKK